MNAGLTERQSALLGPRDQKEPGSKPWVYQTLYSLKRQWQQLDLTVQEWKTTLEELERYKAWVALEYKNLDDLLLSEIGRTSKQSIEDVKARAKVAKPITAHGEIGNGRSRDN